MPGCTQPLEVPGGWRELTAATIHFQHRVSANRFATVDPRRSSFSNSTTTYSFYPRYDQLSFYHDRTGKIDPFLLVVILQTAARFRWVSSQHSPLEGWNRAFPLVSRHTIHQGTAFHFQSHDTFVL